MTSKFYDAFVSMMRGMFNTRDRAEHTRKRKIVSHTFSAQSVGEFEQYIHHNLEEFVQQWDQISLIGGLGSYSRIDALHWFNYLAFDIIGDLAFGQPFGMIRKGKDIAEVKKHKDAPPTYAPAIEVLNRRGEVSATLGCWPELKPYAKWSPGLSYSQQHELAHILTPCPPDPFFSKGIRAVENLAGIAIARVSQRLEDGNPDGRVDLLQRLVEGKDENGQPLGRTELTVEALTQLIAGSDTTSNTSCALLYHVLKHPRVISKLQEELDANISENEKVPLYKQVKDLP